MSDHYFEVTAGSLINIAPDGKLRISSTTPLTIELVKTTTYLNTQYVPPIREPDIEAIAAAVSTRLQNESRIVRNR